MGLNLLNDSLLDAVLIAFRHSQLKKEVFEPLKLSCYSRSVKTINQYSKTGVCFFFLAINIASIRLISNFSITLDNLLTWVKNKLAFSCIRNPLRNFWWLSINGKDICLKVQPSLESFLVPQFIINPDIKHINFIMEVRNKMLHK